MLQEWTSCGLYYFKSAFFMNKCLSEQITKNLKLTSGEFYTSLAIKAMMLKEKISVLNYEVKNFYQFGTPEDWERADYWWTFHKLSSLAAQPLNFKTKIDYEFKFIPTNKRPTTMAKEFFELEKNYWKKVF